jgi:murein DD-endopeptidase MepM/ murein hydrolase activator NlpD
LSNRAVGYDDLDADGNLSPGDRVHYRVDYGNPGPGDVTGVLLRDELDTAHVASAEAITDDGALLEEPAAGIPIGIEWSIGTLAAGAGGFVTYDVFLRGAPVAVRDGWFFPVQGPNSYSDSFGAPRYAGGYHPHAGTDIMCARGTPLVAVVGGIISRTNRTDTGLGGIHIELHGDDGNSYYYAHLSAIQDGIAPGVRVTAGQVIGFAGDTGDARGGAVHLHFGIHPGGGPAIDPYLVLRGEATIAEVARNSTTTTTTTSTTTTSTTLPATDTTTTTTVPTTDTTTTTTTVPTTDTTTTTITVPTTDTTTLTTVPPPTDSTTTSDSTATTTTTPTTDIPTTTTSTGPPPTGAPTTVPAALGPATTAVPVAGAAAVLALAGTAKRRFFSRKKARRRGTRPPECRS